MYTNLAMLEDNTLPVTLPLTFILEIDVLAALIFARNPAISIAWVAALAVQEIVVPTIDAFAEFIFARRPAISVAWVAALAVQEIDTPTIDAFAALILRFAAVTFAFIMLICDC